MNKNISLIALASGLLKYDLTHTKILENGKANLPRQNSKSELFHFGLLAQVLSMLKSLNAYRTHAIPSYSIIPSVISPFHSFHFKYLKPSHVNQSCKLAVICREAPFLTTKLAFPPVISTICLLDDLNLVAFSEAQVTLILTIKCV